VREEGEARTAACDPGHQAFPTTAYQEGHREDLCLLA